MSASWLQEPRIRPRTAVSAWRLSENSLVLRRPAGRTPDGLGRKTLLLSSQIGLV